MPRLLALDFDGVISDSAPEALVVALRTYAELKPDTTLREQTELIRDAGVPSREQVVRDATYPGFLELMPLGNRAEDYAVALAALDAGRELPDQAAYDAFRDGHETAWLRAYHKRFYQLRAGLGKADPEAWRRLMGPYRPFVELLQRRAGETLLAIATSKDRRSVRALLRAYGVDGLFAEDRVLDKETGASKVAHLEHLHRQLGLPYAEMTFVDDKVNHLDAVAPLGTRCALAAWGYNGSREVAHALERGYLVCTLADVESQLFG